MKKKLKVVKHPSIPRSTVRQAKDALKAADCLVNQGFNKVFVILEDAEGRLAFECAGMDDMQRIAMLECAKVLTIKDRFS